MYEEEETHMNQILDMREKRVNLWNAAKAFLDSRRAEDGTLSVEDSATYEKMEADVIRCSMVQRNTRVTSFTASEALI